jgi:DNA-binding GntR family transcriptional regulator
MADNKTSLAEKVYCKLLSELMTLKIKPGAKLK